MSKWDLSDADKSIWNQPFISILDFQTKIICCNYKSHVLDGVSI